MTTPATRDAKAVSARPAPVWPRIRLWFWGKFFILLVAVGSGLHRRRMSHNNGIAGRGTLRVVDDPRFPPTVFFEPGAHSRAASGTPRSPTWTTRSSTSAAGA